jgi:hypothetical protein
VDLVAVAEDEGGHLGVPETGLVTEVDACFQHLAHSDGHMNTSKVGSKIQPDNCAARKGATP